ncbi:MAG: OpcA/G6PD domain-containing protein [Vicinamibacterales bacterium]
MTELLLPSGVDVAFTEIESALLRPSAEAGKPAGMALTATIVVAGPPDRLGDAEQAVSGLKDIGVRAVLISHGDNPAPVPRVSHHVVALNGLRAEYLNNAVAALRLSSLPTLVWWRGGNAPNLEGLARLADRLVLDAENPEEVWGRVEELAQHTSVTDLRWTRLTRWRALMAHFFDIPEVRAAVEDFRTLRIEGSDVHTLRLFAGWILSIIKRADRLTFDLVEREGIAPIESVVLGGGQELVLRMAPSRTCVVTSAQVRNLSSTSRTVSLGGQDLCALLGEELRIRARDVAFERAVAASRNVS